MWECSNSLFSMAIRPEWSSSSLTRIDCHFDTKTLTEWVREINEDIISMPPWRVLDFPADVSGKVWFWSCFCSLIVVFLCFSLVLEQTHLSLWDFGDVGTNILARNENSGKEYGSEKWEKIGILSLTVCHCFHPCFALSSCLDFGAETELDFQCEFTRMTLWGFV